MRWHIQARIFMKKNIKTILYMIGFACIVCSVIMQAVMSNRGAVMSSREYIISPDVTEWMFNSTPQEFLREYTNYENPFNSFGTEARIDDSGNLVLHLTDEQIEAWKESCGGSITVAQNIGYVIKEDYSEFSIIGNKEEVKRKLANFPLWLIHELFLMQILNDVDPHNVSVHAMIIEESTQNILYEAVCPEQELRLSLKDLNFSE